MYAPLTIPTGPFFLLSEPAHHQHWIALSRPALAHPLPAAIADYNMSYPVSFPADKPLMRLERIQTSPNIYVLHFLGAETPDNRLTVPFLEQLMKALEHVEKAWDDQEDQKTGAALITTGETQAKSKFYSNGCVWLIIVRAVVTYRNR